MKVLMVGATGNHAKFVVPELKQRSVTVRTLARDESKIDPAWQQGADGRSIDQLSCRCLIRSLTSLLSRKTSG